MTFRVGYKDGAEDDYVIGAGYFDEAGDRIDSNDAIFPGMANDDDYGRAGAGNNTVSTGAGDAETITDFINATGQNIDDGNQAQSDKIAGREPACLHPDTAAKLGLEEGDILRLWNTRGACLAGLRMDPRFRRDCVSLATGAWFNPQVVDGAQLEVHGNPNVLTLDKECSELSQGNCAHTALVRIEKWTAPLPPLSVDRPPHITGGDTL